MNFGTAELRNIFSEPIRTAAAYTVLSRLKLLSHLLLSVVILVVPAGGSPEVIRRQI